MSKKITAIDLANTILKMHHHDGWSIRVTQGGGSRCMQGLKEIWIDHRDQEDIFLLLHEIAHIRYPDHGREWGARLTCLCQRHIGWAIPMAQWSDEITLAIQNDPSKLKDLKRQWLDTLENWIDWNVPPAYTIPNPQAALVDSECSGNDHSEENPDMARTADREG